MGGGWSGYRREEVGLMGRMGRITLIRPIGPIRSTLLRQCHPPDTCVLPAPHFLSPGPLFLVNLFEKEASKYLLRVVPNSDGTPLAKTTFAQLVLNQTPYMKKHLNKVHRSQLSLGDLILAVSSCSRNSREAAAAVADLLESGQVRLLSRSQKVRSRS